LVAVEVDFMNTCDSPPDVALLLRAHSEQRWLSREVVPVVCQIETRERLPEEQLPAALAYLEVAWAEAAGLARAADAARCRLDTMDVIEQARPARPGPSACGQPTHPLGGALQPLPTKARRYHASVRALREAVARRVATLIATPRDYADRRADALA
jgi:hypothetical protein